MSAITTQVIKPTLALNNIKNQSKPGGQHGLRFYHPKPNASFEKEG
jgi:hypothetical protein